jgi:hypothetical protein
MAFAHSVLTSHTFAPRAPKFGFFRRLLDAMRESRAREAEREVGRYLATHGGKFTDEAEREIERRFFGRPGW